MLKHKYDYKPGETDENGHKILRIFALEKGLYFIYEYQSDNQGSRLGVLAEDEGLVGRNDEFNFLFHKIKELTNTSHQVRTKYLHNLAYSIKNLYDGNSPAAIAGLKETFDAVSRDLRRATVLYYLGGAFTVLTVALFTTAAVFQLSQFVRVEYYSVLNAVVFASLGGFLSCATGARHLAIDLQDAQWAQFLYGGLRLLIAMVSGVITLYLVNGDILLGFVKSNSDALLVLLFISGFSEKFVFNALSKFESDISAGK